MSPSFPSNDMPNCVRPNSVSLTKFFVCDAASFVASANFIDLSIRKFCHSMFTAPWISAFFGRVLIVVRSCSKKKMLRIYAMTNIAMMQNANSDWDFSEVHLPRKPVHQMHFKNGVFGQCSVSSFWTNISCPKPTPTSLLDFLPKRISKILAAIRTRLFPWMIRRYIAHNGNNVT